MSTTTILNPNNPDYERFLYASVGEDRDGGTVSVLSMLSRLDLDPWAEAEDLAALGQDDAGARLEQLLMRCRDVPSLAQDHQAVARILARLLPGRSGVGWKNPGRGTAAPLGLPVSRTTILTVVAVLFVVIQMVFLGTPGIEP